MTSTQILQAILDKVTKLEKNSERVESKIDTIYNDLTTRMDTIGRDVAFIGDDTPTRDELENLEKRVDKIEKKVMN